MEEIGANIFEQVQMIARTNTKKPLTRLQKQAPARFLQVTNCCTNNPYMHSIGTASSPHTPIPLLSPLIVSPTPIPRAGEFRFPEIDVDMDKICDTNKGCTMQGGRGKGGEGWQHPAVANVYMDPSSLFTVFQSKCVLVINHVPSEAS